MGGKPYLKAFTFRAVVGHCDLDGQVLAGRQGKCRNEVVGDRFRWREGDTRLRRLQSSCIGVIWMGIHCAFADIKTALLAAYPPRSSSPRT